MPVVLNLDRNDEIRRWHGLRSKDRSYKEILSTNEYTLHTPSGYYALMSRRDLIRDTFVLRVVAQWEATTALVSRPTHSSPQDQQQ